MDKDTARFLCPLRVPLNGRAREEPATGEGYGQLGVDGVGRMSAAYSDTNAGELTGSEIRGKSDKQGTCAR